MLCTFAPKAARSGLTWGLALFAGLLLALAHPAGAQVPSSGTLGPTVGTSQNWVGASPGGAAVGAQFGNHDDLCEEDVNCETFLLTLTGQPLDWQGKSVRIELHWMVRDVHDYDFYVHKGAPDGPVIASGTRGFTDFERDDLEPIVDGTGDFFVHVVYFTAIAADQYSASATVINTPPGLPLAPIAAGLPPRYQNHTPTAEQIAEGISRNSQDEPNIGVNWLSGKVMFQALLQTLRVTFTDTCPQTPSSFWEDKSPVTSVNSFDPILFTDHMTGRTFVSHLLLNPFASASSFTDNDGESWTPSQGAGAGSGVDHQNIGGGPFHLPLTTGVGYANAVYYCAQDIAFANCALSVDGGLTYGPAVPMYDLRRCAGLHGHLKVGPDGTAYVPNSTCTGQVNPTEQGVAVSEDNGTTWEVRTIPGSINGGSDPSVAVDEAGRLYMGFTHANQTPAVAVSDDHGRTWKNMYDVGTMVGIKNAVFPAVVAGGPGRAAMTFYGTTTDGPASNFNFDGFWDLYVAHTYDGGASWITVNATPNDALQRGGIHLGGGSQIHRNLLDFFDADVDAQGRVVVGYADGCLGTCTQAAPTARGNSYTAFAVIARQSGGRRLYAAFDPAEPTVPGAPWLTVTRNGRVTRLTWSQSENGGSPITRYRIFRRTLDGPQQLLAEVGGTTKEYTDLSGDPQVTYAYRVVARNNFGSSCGTNEVVAKPVGSSCVPPGITVVEDRTGDQLGAPADPDMDIQSISIGEPFFGAGVNKLVFTMKVASLQTRPPNRMWRILWHYPDGPTPPLASFVGRYYIGMNTDAAGAVSFEYGIVRNQSLVIANVLPPTSLGAPDPESTFNPDGTITLVISTDKIGNPEAGDLIGGLVGRAFPVRQNNTLRGDTAADSVTFASTYILVGNASCQNHAPDAVDDTATTCKNRPVRINVLANDSDPDGDPLTVTAVSDPPHGTAANNGDGTVTYTPDRGFVGTDSFTYTISDGRGGSDTAAVSVTVARCDDDGDDDDDFDDDGERDDDDGDDDNDGVGDDADGDDDNDGVGDDADDDDDNDNIRDEFDSESHREAQQTQSSNHAAGQSTDYAVQADANTLLVIALVEAPNADLLTVEIYNPAGSLVASSLPTPGRALATAPALSPGTYVVRVRNNSSGTIASTTTLITRNRWF